MRRSWLFVLLMGCRNVDPAPADLDGLARFFWSGFEVLDDASLIDGVVNADAALADLDEPIDGLLTDLTAEEAATVPVDGAPDPALAAGFFLASKFACTVDQVERIVIALDQLALYEGAYDTYTRTYTADDAAYLAREADTLSWDVALTSAVLGGKFSETLHGAVRRPAAEAPFGPFLVQRTWMPTPAVFEGGNRTFTQDYQIEVYWERAPGEMIHLYGLWRAFDYGSGFTQDNEAAIGIVLGNLKKWDEGTAELCADGRP